MKYPCKECGERTIGCHGYCEKYQVAKAESEAVTKARIKVRADNQYHIDRLTKCYTKMLKEGR